MSEGKKETAPEIPTLTDILPDPDLATDRPGNSPAASSGEVISRVQAQNLEHSVYQKLRKDLDTHIAEVVRSRFMPEIGAALSSALQHISHELKTNITAVVQTSLERALQAPAQPALENKAGGGDAKPSGTMPP